MTEANTKTACECAMQLFYKPNHTWGQSESGTIYQKSAIGSLMKGKNNHKLIHLYYIGHLTLSCKILVNT